MDEQTLLHDRMGLAARMQRHRLFTRYELNNCHTLNEQVLQYCVFKCEFSGLTELQ